MFLSDEGPMLETLDFTIRIGSTPTFLIFQYFNLYHFLNILNAILTQTTSSLPKQDLYQNMIIDKPMQSLDNQYFYPVHSQDESRKGQEHPPSKDCKTSQRLFQQYQNI